MSYNCESGLPQNVCTDDIFVKVKNYPASSNAQIPVPTSTEKLIKIPVKIAIVDVTEPIRDSIYICDGFEDVKHIKRSVTLTQCHITENFLYVEGYILKNIGYAVPCGNEENECGHYCKVVKNEYKDLTAKLDFHFTTPIKLQGVSNVYNCPIDEGSYFVDCMKPCDQGNFGELPCEKFYKQTVFLNEPFKSELEEYSIAESVILKRESCETQWRYDTIIEKLELSLKIAILQNQQIVVAVEDKSPKPPTPIKKDNTSNEEKTESSEAKTENSEAKTENQSKQS